MLLFQSYKGLTETSIKKKVKVVFVHLPFALQAAVLRNRTPFPKLDGCLLKVGSLVHVVSATTALLMLRTDGMLKSSLVWSCAYEGIAGAGFSWQFPMANPVKSRDFILPMWEKRSRQFARARKEPGCCTSFCSVSMHILK